MVVADATPTGGTLFVVDAANPAAPSVLGSTTTAGLPRGVAIDSAGAVAVVAEGPLGVEVFDLADPARPVARGRAATGDARAVALDDGYALVADAASSLTVVDVRDLDAAARRGDGSARARRRSGRRRALRRPRLHRRRRLLRARRRCRSSTLTDPAMPLARTRLRAAHPRSRPRRRRRSDLRLSGRLRRLRRGRQRTEPSRHRPVSIAARPARRRAVGRARSRLAMATSSPPARACRSSPTRPTTSGVLAVELLVDGAVVGRDERPPYGATVTVPDTVDRLTRRRARLRLRGQRAPSPRRSR